MDTHLNLGQKGILCSGLVAGISLMLSPSAHGEIIIDSSWVHTFTTAAAANFAQSNGGPVQANAGLDVDLTQSVSAFVPGYYIYPSTSAFANTSVNATFNNGVFTTNMGWSISTSSGVYPVAQSIDSLLINFRVVDQNESAPVLTKLSDTRTSSYPSDPGYTFYSIFNPGTGSSVAGSTLAPGSYQATFGIGGVWNSYNIGGSAGMSASASIDFGTVTLAPGFNQQAPILPAPNTGNNPCSMMFGACIGGVAVPSGTWFDPPATSGFTYTMADGGLFTDILNFPSGFNGEFQVVVDGMIVGTFGAGEAVNFKSLVGHDVGSFQILGIDPTVDSEDPVAFPIQLAFNTPTATFTMTPVPEPESYAMMLAGIALVGAAARRRLAA